MAVSTPLLQRADELSQQNFHDGTRLTAAFKPGSATALIDTLPVSQLSQTESCQARPALSSAVTDHDNDRHLFDTIETVAQGLLRFCRCRSCDSQCHVIHGDSKSLAQSLAHACLNADCSFDPSSCHLSDDDTFSSPSSDLSSTSAFAQGQARLCLRFDQEHCHLSQHAQSRGRRIIFGQPETDDIWLQPNWQHGQLRESTVVTLLDRLAQQSRKSTSAHVFASRVMMAVGSQAARWFEDRLDHRVTPLGRLRQLLTQSNAYGDLENSTAHVTSACQTLRTEYHQLKRRRTQFQDMCARKRPHLLLA